MDYDYIKNHYKLIAVDLSRQKNWMLIRKQSGKQNLLDQTIKKSDDNGNAIDAGNNQSMFDLTIFEKIKETRLKFSQCYKSWRIMKRQELN